MIIFKMTYKEREVILIDLQVEKMRLLYQSYERKRETFIIKDYYCLHLCSVFSLSRGREGFLRYMHGHLHNVQVINKCSTEQKDFNFRHLEAERSF